MGALSWWLLATTLHAQEPEGRKVILAAGEDVRAALKLAARDTQIDVERLEPVDLSRELAGLSPVVTGPGSAIACTGPTTTAATFARLVDDIDRLARESGGDFEPVFRPIAEAEAALYCLSEPVEASVAAKLYLWRGATRSATDLSATIASFRQMLRFAPDAVWKSDLQDLYGRAAFEQARDLEREAFKVVLQVIPSGLEDLWIDGRRVEDSSRGVQVAPGDHLVQLRLPGELDARSLRVTVEGGGVPSLVIPTAIPADATSWVADDQGRRHLSAALAAVLGSNIPVYVVADDHVWGGTTGLDDWSVLSRPQVDVPLAARALTYGGGGVAVGGITAMAALWGKGQGDDVSPDQWDVYRQQFQVGEAFMWAGLAATAGGLYWTLDIRRDQRLSAGIAPTSDDGMLVFLTGLW